MILNLILFIIMFGIVVENFTELVVKDSITENFRMLFFTNEIKPKFLGDFFKDLFSCGRCFSGWASAFAAIMYNNLIINILFGPLNIFIQLIIVFGLWHLIWFLANTTHHIRDRLNPNHPYKDED